MPKQRKLPEIDLKLMFREMVAEVDESYIIDALKPHLSSITYLLGKSSGNLTKIIDRLKSENFPGTKEQLRRIILELCGEPNSLEDEEDGQNIPRKSKGRPPKKTQYNSSDSASGEDRSPTRDNREPFEEKAEGNDQPPSNLSSTASASSLSPASNTPSVAPAEYQPPIPDRRKPDLVASVERNRAAKLQQDSEGR
jgi:hypothetical protein